MNSVSRREADSAFDLGGLTALVTGATGGIGKAIAIALSDAGARVYLHGRPGTGAEAAAAELGARPLTCDLSAPAEIAAMCDAVADHPWGLDVLVNNAGVERHARADEVDEQLIEETFAVNYTAPALLLRGLLPMLERSDNASVLNISSIHDRVPFQSNSTYAASKAALRMLTESLAVELGPRRIRVNAIAPGAIATDINREVIARIGPARFAELIPLGRIGTVEDIIGPAVFLASRAAAYVTGATLVVDGGYSHHLVRYRDDAGLEGSTDAASTAAGPQDET